MCFLIILIYFIIGFVIGLFIYDYYCKDFNKTNKSSPLKLTWEEYASKKEPGTCLIFSLILWPILLLVAICYYTFQYPINCIKKRNGIK